MHYEHSFAYSLVHVADSLVELDAERNQVAMQSQHSCCSHSALVAGIAAHLELGSTQGSGYAGIAGRSWDAGKMKMAGEESGMAELVY